MDPQNVRESLKRKFKRPIYKSRVLSYNVTVGKQHKDLGEYKMTKNIISKEEALLKMYNRLSEVTSQLSTETDPIEREMLEMEKDQLTTFILRLEA